jgi:ERF superfamily
VRKVLGQHEIATVQTTAVDQAVGLINLTTVLAHALRGMDASDWPVCALAETAHPQRMSAALTYARRYALFTLVGIAGEDDLDAPDLVGPMAAAALARATPGRNGQFNDQRSRSFANGKGRSPARPPALTPEESAAARDRLIAVLK